MNNDYLVWLLILGLAVAGWLLWLVQGRLPREETDLLADERALEADWISRQLDELGEPVAPERVELVLEAHQRYLSGPPLDMPEASAAISTTARASGRDATPVQRHDARREAPEADVGQAG